MGSEFGHGELPFPHGKYDVWADDDDVIGLTVAKTYLQDWPIVRTDPPFMDAFDEFKVGQFLAWCMTKSETLLAEMKEDLDGD